MKGLGKELKLFDSYIDMHDVQFLYIDRSKTSAVSIQKLIYEDKYSLSMNAQFLCYVDPQLVEEFIQRRGDDTLWNVGRLRHYANTYVTCQAIVISKIQPLGADEVGEAPFSTTKNVYEVERFATDDAGIKMKVLGLSRRYCLPSSVLRFMSSASIPGGHPWQFTTVDDHILVNQNHWVCASRIEQEERDVYNKYLVVEGEYYTRDAIESGIISNIVYDHYNDDYVHCDNDDVYYGYIARNDEGYFCSPDYCYSETCDRYFMDSYVAEEMNYHWCERRSTYVYEDDLDNDDDDYVQQPIQNYSYRPEFFYTEKDRFAYSPRDIGKKSHIPDYGGGYCSKSSETYNMQCNTQVKYLGIELEVEPKIDYSSCAQSTMDKLGDKAYCKSDSSVQGYEIVTHPVTYEYAKSMSWRDTLKQMRKRGTTSYKSGRCGVHVHVNKLALNKLQWASVIMFMDMYKREVKALSQRSTATLDRWSKIRGVRHYFSETSSNSSRSLANLITHGRFHSSERYSAINTQPNRTVEFRLFRGTTKYESFIAYIEFVDCLTEFVKQYSTTLVLREYLEYQRDIRDGCKLWELFCVFAQVKQYKYLCDMLNRKHINV